MDGKKVNYSGENGYLTGYLFTPEGCGNQHVSGLVVAHAWWGVNDEIKQHSREFSDLGPYKTLLPDFYRGKVATNREDAGHYMADLDWSGALMDIKASVKYLKEQEKCAKVGVIGFCMGGALSFMSAGFNVPGLDAAVSFYGIPRPEIADMSKSGIPMQGHFGELDTVIGLSSPKDVSRLQNDLENTPAASNLELNIYPSAHGFMHPTYENYDVKQSVIATRKMKIFLNKYI